MPAVGAGSGGDGGAGSAQAGDAGSSMPVSEMVSKNWGRAKENARKARAALDGLGASRATLGWNASARGAVCILAAAAAVAVITYAVPSALLQIGT